MKQKIAKLIDVKSIITLAMTLTFSALCFKGKVTAEQLITIYTVVIGFYFGTQATKK